MWRRSRQHIRSERTKQNRSPIEDTDILADHTVSGRDACVRAERSLATAKKRVTQRSINMTRL